MALDIEEYGRFVAIAREEARGRLCLIHHAAFGDLKQNIEAVGVAERSGAELVLLTYPPSFYPTTSKEIYDYTRDFCARTNLGVILFPVPHWGFERIHPAGMEPGLIAQIVADIPNIVCIKAEGGMPTIAGFVQTYLRHSADVVVTFPVEAEAIPLAALVPMQFIGTSNGELFRDNVPKMHKFMVQGNVEAALELYWKLHPLRMANMQISRSYIGPTGTINRMLWKYQGWLNGFNGGPLRCPTMRVVDAHMRSLRSALTAVGLPAPTEKDTEFFIGRNPQ